MGNELQNIVDKENLDESVNGLREFTDKICKKREFYMEILNVDNERLDELQLKFLCNNPDYTFDEIQIVKSVFDYLKGE